MCDVEQYFKKFILQAIFEQKTSAQNREKFTLSPGGKSILRPTKMPQGCKEKSSRKSF